MEKSTQENQQITKNVGMTIGQNQCTNEKNAKTIKSNIKLGENMAQKISQ